LAYLLSNHIGMIARKVALFVKSTTNKKDLNVST